MATVKAISVPAALRSGEFVTPDGVVPASLQGVTLQVVMPNQADRDNPAATMEIRIEFSRDGGATFKPYLMAGWHGGAGITDHAGVFNPPPNVTLGGNQLAALVGAKVRAGFTIGIPITVGCDVSVTS